MPPASDGQACSENPPAEVAAKYLVRRLHVAAANAFQNRPFLEHDSSDVATPVDIGDHR